MIYKIDRVVEGMREIEKGRWRKGELFNFERKDLISIAMRE